MRDYYKVLGVNQSASSAEIKRAYRSLARHCHPDIKGGSEQATHEFAAISAAYEILSDPDKRSLYDAQLDKPHSKRTVTTSFYNAYARRAQREAGHRHVQNLFNAERQDNTVLQHVVYPIITLLLGAFYTSLLRPHIWTDSGMLVRVTLIVLFLIAVLHLVKRIHSCLLRYTILDKFIETSMSAVDGPTNNRITARSALALITVGVVISSAAGLLIGRYIDPSAVGAVPFLFATKLHPELFLYPAILVLIVDTIHTIALKIDL